MFKNLTLPALVLAGALVFLGAPSAPIAAYECGGPGDNECQRIESCLNIWFFKHCTTRIDYWQGLNVPELPGPEPVEFPIPSGIERIGFH